MDKGRIMDNAQNNNARYIDNFNNAGKTSVKTSNPPGGKSSFSLGWDNSNDDYNPAPKKNFKNLNQQNQNTNYAYDQQQQSYNNNNAPKTNVRVNFILFYFIYFFIYLFIYLINFFRSNNLLEEQVKSLLVKF